MIELDQISVVIPRKEDVATESKDVQLWPLIEAALDKVEAMSAARDAAEVAIQTSAGCCALANFFNSQAKRIHKMDYRFKTPLIVWAAELADKDELSDVIYCPKEGCVYFETDESQYSFHVFKEWTVDWEAVSQEVIEGYEWDGISRQDWALDDLLAFLNPTEYSDPKAEDEEVDE